MALTVRQYVTADGKRPFLEWVRSLTKAVGARIQLRVQRFELGNLGDHKHARWGVGDAAGTLGPGYRIDFGQPESPADPQPSPQSHAGHAESASEAVSPQAKPRPHLRPTEAASRRVGHHESANEAEAQARLDEILDGAQKQLNAIQRQCEDV